MTGAHTILRNIDPDCLIVKGVPVFIKAFEIFPDCRAVTVDGGILLVAEDPRTWDTVTGSTAALVTNRLVFVTFHLSLATRHAGRVSGGRKAYVEGYLPSCS
jgi:hypothetical protein